MMDFVAGQSAPPAGAIAYYSLDCQQRGEQYFYVWRHQPMEAGDPNRVCLLIDLDNTLLPEVEIEKLVSRLDRQFSGLQSVAFFNCHISNQREIKRKLKAYDVRLYSKTAFFIDLTQAKQWLLTRSVNC